MSAQETQLTFTLDGGIVTTALEEAVQLPSLLRSDNTRLSPKRGTVTAAPAPEPILDLPSAEGECAGVVPSGRVDSSVLFLNHAGGQTQRIAGTDHTTLKSVLQPTATQNGYRPAEIATAGVINGALELRAPALCVHQGLRVYATMRYTATPTEVGVYVTAIDANGKVVIAPQFAFSLGNEVTPLILFQTLWLALTSHGTNGIRVWYTKADNEVHRRAITISGLTIAVGAEVDHSDTLVFAPTILEVVAMNDTTAFLLHQESPLNTATRLDKTNIVADTYSRELMDTPASSMVSMAYLPGTIPYVAVNYRIATGNDWFRSVWRADTFVEVFSQTADPGTSRQFTENAVQFLVEPNGTAYGIFVLSRKGSLPAIHDGTGDADDPSFLLFACVELATGTLVASARRNWMRLADRGATVALGTVERLPVFSLTRDYEFILSNRVDSPAFVPDPSREMYSVVRGVPDGLHITPVARYAVDTAARITYVTGPAFTAVDGRRVVCAYQTETYEFATRLYTSLARYVEIDFTAKQPRFALDSGGVALIAAAQPATWDGREVVEAGPLHTPAIVGYTDDGDGDALVSTYRFRAVVSWRDAAGQIHRSPPSPECKLVGTDVAPITPRIYVTVADTLRDGISQELYSVTLYQAGPETSDDPALVASTVYFSRTDYEPTTDGIVWAFTDIDEGPSHYPENILYTTGDNGELAAESPPPLWDVAAVGPRMWGIHGELRRRAVFTKKRLDGYAPEWSSALFVDMPAAAGNLIAVTELDGKPLLLGQNGVYTLDGEGPTNLGEGEYGDPRCVASIACTSRESVVRFPGGVLFQTGSRMALMQPGGGVRVFDEIDAEGLTFTSALVLPTDQEVVFAVNTGSEAYGLVYNYVLDRWTKWTTFLRFSALVLATPTRAIAYASAARTLVYINVDEPGATSIDQETGVIMPAGPQGDCNIRELIVQGVYREGYTLRVRAYQDYSATTAFDEVYTEDQLLAACDGGKPRFTLRIALDEPISRAIRVRFTAESVDGDEPVEWMPVAVTIPLGVNPSELRRHVAAGMK